MRIELTREEVRLLRDALDSYAYENAPREARFSGMVDTDWIDDYEVREDIEQAETLDAKLADALNDVRPEYT